MNNTSQKRNISEAGAGANRPGGAGKGVRPAVLAAAVAGIVPVPVSVVVARKIEGAVGEKSGETVGENLPEKRAAGEMIEIPSDQSVMSEAGLEIDGEVGAVAVVSEEEARTMSLTEEQSVAIEKLTQGRTRIEAATAAGVSRMTLYRWLNHDPAFQAAYNAWQQDVFSTTRGQMVATMPDAMRAVIKAIRGGDVKLAWKLLESQGVTERAEVGPTDVEELKKREALERKRKEVEEKKERARLDQDEMFGQFG